jgi:hypothetical protein
MATEEEIRALKRQYSARLLSHPGVAGVGVEREEDGDYFLAIHLTSNDPAVRRELPAELDRHAVKYLVSGQFRKQSPREDTD